MAGSFSYVDPRSVSRAVASIFTDGSDAARKEETRLLNADYMRERLRKTREEADQLEAAGRANSPDAVRQRVSLETGMAPGLVKETEEQARSGFVPEGPRPPDDIEAKMRASLRRNADPLSRTQPQRVAAGQETVRKGDEAADMVKRALKGELDEPARANAVAQARGVNVMRNPHAIQGNTGINRETGKQKTTEVGESISGVNLARGAELKSRSGANDALARQRDATADRQKRTDPNRPRGGGSQPGGDVEERRKYSALSLEANRRGLKGQARDEFIEDGMAGGYRRQPDAEPLSGASAPESVRGEFSADPKNKGKRIGSYERGRGYAVYDGKKLIGYVREAR